jgi:hypothetical protein
MELGWHTEPGCIQHDIPGSDGVYKAYEKCSDFFTFGHGSTLGTGTSGVNVSYWILVAIAFLASIGFLVAWVVMEDRKLTRQAERLLRTGQAGQVHLPGSGTGGPA